MYKGTITVTSHWKKINLKLEDILYVKMQRNDCDIHLASGETLTIRTTFKEFEKGNVPMTEADYREYYKSFDNVPFAFTDIEMVFNEDRHAVDWIFCYGNEPLATLEKVPLEKLIGNSFGSIFENMDGDFTNIPLYLVRKTKELL